MTETAIIEYVNSLSPVKILNLEDLATGEVLCGIGNLLHPPKIDISKVLFADSWIPKLSNLKLFLKSLEAYSEDQLGQKLYLKDVDLLKIAKYEEKPQIIKLFQIFLSVLMSSRNKQDFIQKIMEMEEHSQQYLTEIVKRVMEATEQSHNEIHSNSGSTLLQKLDELEHQIDALKHQNKKLTDKSIQQEKQNSLLREQVSKLYTTISHLNQQVFDKDIKSSHADMFSNNSLIESLKQKLIVESVQNEKQKIRMNEQIQLMRLRLEKIDDIQSRTETYQHKMNSLNQKIVDLEQDLEQTKDQLTRKVQSIAKLQQKNRIMGQKFNKQELQKISLQIDVSKQNVRNASDESKKSTIQSRSQNLLLQQSSKRESEEQLAIANRRIRALEKELTKSNLKAEKASRLQTDKKQLEETFIKEIRVKKQQIQILVSALVEVKLQHLNWKSS